MGTTCVGVCVDSIYENDGICNVPLQCEVGTDCADCEKKFPTFELVSTIASALMVVFILCLLYIRVRNASVSKRLIGSKSFQIFTSTN